MSVIKINLKPLFKGKEPHKEICGELLLIDKVISYLGDINPKNGTVFGNIKIKDRILMYLGGIGSTVGSYKIYGLALEGNAPKALIITYIDEVTVVGAVLANIPLFLIKKSDFKKIKESVNSGNNIVHACIKDEVLIIEGYIHSY